MMLHTQIIAETIGTVWDKQTSSCEYLGKMMRLPHLFKTKTSFSLS